MIGGNKNSNQSTWKNKFFFLLLIIILIFFIYNYTKTWIQSSEINKEIVSIESNINNLEDKNVKLQELIEYFNSTAYIEERARRDLGLKKEGEKVAIVNNQNIKEISPSKNKKTTTSSAQSSNPAKWWNYFFK